MASVVERAVTGQRSEHLTELEVAAFLDGASAAEDLARIQSHLLECIECRDEIVQTSRLAPSVMAPARRRPHWWVPVAAAAALVLLIARPETVRRPSEHREAPVTMTVSPRALAPAGLTDAPRTFVWTAVPSAYRYQVRVQSDDGTIIWEQLTTDTALTMPASIALRARHTYFWRVESVSGFERRAASELMKFTTRADEQ